MNFCKKLLCVAISMVFVTASMYGCGSQGVASSGGNASQAEGASGVERYGNAIPLLHRPPKNGSQTG